MTWFGGGRKLRIEEGGCADMTRISNYLAGRQLNDVLSQVRIVDVSRTIRVYRLEGVDTCQTVNLIAHPPRPKGERVVLPSFSGRRCIHGYLQGECQVLTPASYFIPGMPKNKFVSPLGQVDEKHLA